VIYDEKVNVDQLQVIYNALKKPVTYVQGPPGTGKTNTIFNLLISLYFSNKTALVCTNNNKPVDGIIDRFTKEGDFISTVEFPYIRLGNKEVMIEATKKLIRLLQIDLPELDKDVEVEEDDLDIDEKSKNDELVELLNLYDKKRELTENIDCARKLLDSAKKGKGNDHGIISAIEKQLIEFEKENEKYPEVKNTDALSKVTIASTSEAFRKAIKNDSIKRIRKLRGGLFKSLRECLLIQDDEERVKAFNKWLISPGNTEVLTKVFPIVFCTNISADKLGRDHKFDIAIMDESGQCDMAKALIPISRAERMLLVGDPAQLQPVIVLDRSVNESLKEKYLIDDKFDYIKQSILTHCLDSDKVSARLLLSYHYRSSKQIAYFASRRFYNGKLKLDFAKQEGQIKFFDCENSKASTKEHEALDEAFFIVNYIKKYGLDKEKQGNVLIISPFKQQAELINRLLKSKEIYNVVASTIHSVQGGEADTVFFSTAVSRKTKASTFRWLSEQDEIINVAWTRAKKNIFVFGDSTSIKVLAKNTGNRDCALLAAVDYAQNNGNVVVVPSQNEFFAFGKSNGSTSEDEFYETITQLFSVNARFECARNVRCSKAFGNAPEFKGRDYEYDFVIYQKGLFGGVKPSHIFEINGAEHYTVDKRIKTDKMKQEVATRYGVKYYMVPNEQVKDYEMFKMLLSIGTDKQVTSDEKDKMGQMTLFSEEE
ncbi:MAG: ATP-binding protein, partial [Bacilli bacterium]|nr:ATP-binding protein [Bacilli bacterium]